MRDQQQMNCFPDKSYIERQSADCTVYRIDFEDGFGRMTAYSVMPGVTLIFNDFHTASGFSNETRRPGLMEINHCRVGRYECRLADGRTLSLGPQDFSVSDMGRPPRDSSFTMGKYHGISLVVDVAAAQQALSAMLGKDAPCPEKFFHRLFSEQAVLILRADPKIQQLFFELYNVPHPRQNAYFKLKTAELLLFLERRKDQAEEDGRYYFSRDLSRRIREIEHYMTEDLRIHISISELAARFKLGETTIKKRFTQLYGEPPYAYLKRRRMEAAAFLLETSELPIAEVAAAVGYQNASKFSGAFVNTYGMAPRDYKKGIQLD
jgi:AraC-like DNA-binding protein